MNNDVTPADAELAKLIAKLFVQRKDTKAVQNAAGGYRPVRTPWVMGDFYKHLQKRETFGHYVCDAEGFCKMFVFDIDLEKTGSWVQRPDLAVFTDISEEDFDALTVIHTEGVNPRELWADHSHESRAWFKLQLRTMVELLTSGITKELGLPTVSTYSGNKGCHVYCFFPEPVPAAEARACALLALEYAGNILSPTHEIKSSHGNNFFQYSDPSPETGYQNLSIELFPKQEKIEDLGNLVRLPMGRNRKSKSSAEPTFFLDQRAPHTHLVAHPDPIVLLKSGVPWA